MNRSALARLAATALVIVGAAGQANAQSQRDARNPFDPRPLNIFEAMFPDLIQQRIQRQRVLQPAQPVEKISGPRYYTYEADRMVRIAVPVPKPDDVIQQVTAVLASSEAGAQTDDLQTATVVEAEPDPDAAALARIGAHFGAVDVRGEPAIAKAIAEYYAQARRPLWLDGALLPNARARTVMPLFEQAGEYGLEPEDYLVETPAVGATPEETAAEAARFEIAMTARALRYALDARAGRINPNRISGYHDFPENRADAAKLLSEIVEGLAVRVLLAQHPQHAQFEAFRRELAELAGQQDDTIVIADGTLIKPGLEHPELANVMKALAKKTGDEFQARFPEVFAEGAVTSAAYTPELVEVVKAFQKDNGLGVDGIIGRGTISRLTDIGVAQKRDRVILAMEQLRWHPRELGNPYVFINQPAFRARFVEDGRSKLDMRVVVGTAKNQSSFFHDEIETVEFNPYWGIPQSILVNEYLPKLRANPAYLDERGYIVTDARGRRIPSSAIDWWSMGGKVPFDVRQLPGEANALGNLKILFPNKHAIYMHDTPQKQLFGNDIRAYSHGCVRLQQPREMAAAVLGTSVDYINKRLGEGHGQDEVKRKIPVYVAYFTAWPDDNGAVEYFADIYGRDGYLTKAIETTRKSRNAAS